MKLDITNKIYNDEAAARAHLEEQLWPDGPVCPHCHAKDVTAMRGKAHRKGLYQCNSGKYVLDLASLLVYIDGHRRLNHDRRYHRPHFP